MHSSTPSASSSATTKSRA